MNGDTYMTSIGSTARQLTTPAVRSDPPPKPSKQQQAAIDAKSLKPALWVGGALGALNAVLAPGVASYPAHARLGPGLIWGAAGFAAGALLWGGITYAIAREVNTHSWREQQASQVPNR